MLNRNVCRQPILMTNQQQLATYDGNDRGDVTTMTDNNIVPMNVWPACCAGPLDNRRSSSHA